jgi:hypothetical protein
MNKRVTTKIGDVFCVAIDDKFKKYLQYIVSDLTQLNSDVVRTFKELYPVDAEPDMEEVIKGDVDFYAHCMTGVGMKKGLWKKVGNIKDVGNTRHILFRNKRDYSDSEKQDDWVIWNVNEEMICIGKLDCVSKQAYLGVVFQPERIVYKMKTGKSYGVYEKYE